MIDGNSLRDQMKDAIRECLLRHDGVSEEMANEITYDVADEVFDVLAITPEYQDKNYEHELMKLADFYETREHIT